MDMDAATVAQPPLRVETDDGVQLWTMQLAPVNPINDTMLDAFDAAIDAASNNDRVAAVVIDSGLRVFSGGADATWMAETVARIGVDGLLAEFNASMDRFRDVCVRLHTAPFLVIAAIGGHALAGGLELAAACDLRFCSDSERLRLGVPEMDLFGCLPSGGGGAQFLGRLLRPAAALQFILDAKPVPPSRALAMGLVDRLCADDDVRAEAVQFAHDVAKKAGRTGVRCAKQALFSGVELPLAEAMVLDHSLHWDNMRRGNFSKGVAAFTARYASEVTR
jgi:enoyl-CoA hydratase